MKRRTGRSRCRRASHTCFPGTPRTVARAPGMRRRTRSLPIGLVRPGLSLTYSCHRAAKCAPSLGCPAIDTGVSIPSPTPANASLPLSSSVGATKRPRLFLVTNGAPQLVSGRLPDPKHLEDRWDAFWENIIGRHLSECCSKTISHATIKNSSDESEYSNSDDVRNDNIK